MTINNTGKIILIDQDLDFSTQVKRVIEQESEYVELIMTTSRDKALEKLNESNFCAILSAYNIESGDDLELLKEVRKERGLDIPYILLMDKMNDRVMLRALDLGANRVFHKRKNVVLSSQILNKILKQEIQYYELRKELEYQRKTSSQNNIIGYSFIYK